MIQWKEEYRIGVKEIDEQHKKLFEIANKAYDLLKDEYSYDKFDDIVEILEELRDYTIYHFSFEEKYMESIGYPRLFSHKAEHRSFVNKINTVDLEAIDESQNDYILSILDFIVNWISNHILGRDKLIVSE